MKRRTRSPTASGRAAVQHLEAGCARASWTSIALHELAAFDPRQAELVELCAFLGCGRGEAADLLGISLATATRDFRIARARLSQHLQREAEVGDEGERGDAAG